MDALKAAIVTFLSEIYPNNRAASFGREGPAMLHASKISGLAGGNYS